MRFFGKAYLYHPIGKNYFLIILNVDPDTALQLLHEGFFVHYEDMRGRLLAKALESKRIQRILDLYKTFKNESFTSKDAENVLSGINYSTINRAVKSLILSVNGVKTIGSGRVHWYRKYKFTKLGLDLIAPLLVSGVCASDSTNSS